VPDVASADKLLQAEKLLDEFFDSYDPNLYLVDDATDLMGRMTRMNRRVTAACLNTARRLEKVHVHKNQGFKTAAGWLASLTDQPVGQAAESLGTAKAMENHPEVKDAFSSGQLSESQAKEIASASEVSPEKTRELIDDASLLGLGELKRRCREIRAVGESEEDEVARHERIRKTRFCRTWVDSEGAGHLEARMTADALAILRSVMGEYERDVFEEARRSGRRETRQAYLADALVAMAVGALGQDTGDCGAQAADADPADTDATDTGGATDTADDGATADDRSTADPATPATPATTKKSACRRTSRVPAALIRITVTGDALLRGHVVAGETCSIPGFGPVPVALARELIDDAILELVVTRGIDVTTVVSDSRYVRKALRIALEERDKVCVVPGCNASDPLERDHWRVDYSKDGPTELDNLARICPWHHDLKTHRGYRLDGPPGQWRFLSPDEVAKEKSDQAAEANPQSERPTGESRAGPRSSGPSSRNGSERTNSETPQKRARAKDPPQQTLL
jgi:hypothetical protein